MCVAQQGTPSLRTLWFACGETQASTTAGPHEPLKLGHRQNSVMVLVQLVEHLAVVAHSRLDRCRCHNCARHDTLNRLRVDLLVLRHRHILRGRHHLDTLHRGQVRPQRLQIRCPHGHRRDGGRPRRPVDRRRRSCGSRPGRRRLRGLDRDQRHLLVIRLLFRQCSSSSLPLLLDRTLLRPSLVAATAQRKANAEGHRHDEQGADQVREPRRQAARTCCITEDDGGAGIGAVAGDGCGRCRCLGAGHGRRCNRR
mmetsp:Transcript_16736/g.43217  ORF Transcript_16736/g.43217 Transcript_16736/m.43217 type:complete len:254 (+) Transcript_16736:99-860(+)